MTLDHQNNPESGKNAARVDSRAKSTGTATFTQDIRLPGMLTAVVAHPPRFGAKLKSSERKADVSKVLFDVEPEDLIKFGLIPEFIGRLPMISSVSPLDRDSLIRILIEPRNALVKQFRKLFELDGVELEFTPDAVEAIADLALLRGTGARGLRAILEEHALWGNPAWVATAVLEKLDPNGDVDKDSMLCACLS